jgi:hypothetical protein
MSFYSILIYGSCGIAICLIIGFVVLNYKKEDKEKQYEKKLFLTDNEKEFSRRLFAALPDYHVFAQVSMGAVLKPDTKIKENQKNYASIRGTFSQKIIDFVICDPNFDIVALVELDDKTHIPSKDKKRDNMTNQAGYITIRWSAIKKPNEEEIANAIAALPGAIVKEAPKKPDDEPANVLPIKKTRKKSQS